MDSDELITHSSELDEFVGSTDVCCENHEKMATMISRLEQLHQNLEATHAKIIEQRFVAPEPMEVKSDSVSNTGSASPIWF